MSFNVAKKKSFDFKLAAVVDFFTVRFFLF